MSDIDDARVLIVNATANLDRQLRPQDAATVVADLGYLAPVIASLLERLGRNLRAAERLPGLYSSAGANPRTQLHQARAELATAQRCAGMLADLLDSAHESLACLGYGDTTARPLRAVEPGDS